MLRKRLNKKLVKTVDGILLGKVESINAITKFISPEKFKFKLYEHQKNFIKEFKNQYQWNAWNMIQTLLLVEYFRGHIISGIF